MAKSNIAKVFSNGRSQAVRLPAEFRFTADRVRVSRFGQGVLLEPVIADVQAWFGALDRLNDEPFMANGREQPLATDRSDLS